jgi:hypothetical protein
MARGLIDQLVDAKRKLDLAARVLIVLDNTPDSMVGQRQRDECVRIVGETRAAFDEQIEALSSEDRWQFVLALMLSGALSYDE